MYDCVVIGGGVIGLSLARLLAGAGRRVALLDRGPLGGEASWAGAGILPAALFRPHDPPPRQLAGLSVRMHAEWAAELREETGIDNGYRATGELYVASDPERCNELRGWLAEWESLGLEPQVVDRDHLAELEPSLRDAAGEDRLPAVYLPGSGQLRNPRHLKALVASCRCRGVELLPGVAVEDWEVGDGRLLAVRTGQGRIEAEQFCLAGGAWSGELAARLSLPLKVKPIRGQIVLLRQPYATLRRVLNEGLRYLVPRDDGRLLVGSTLEDVGWLKQNTAEGVGDLLALAGRLLPASRSAEVERCWSGLRPATPDGLPYLGPVPGLKNLFVAAGHFRSGLQLSTGTARLMSQLMNGESPEIDPTPFRLDRG